MARSSAHRCICEASTLSSICEASTLSSSRWQMAVRCTQRCGRAVNRNHPTIPVSRLNYDLHACTKSTVSSVIARRLAFSSAATSEGVKGGPRLFGRPLVAAAVACKRPSRSCARRRASARDLASASAWSSSEGLAGAALGAALGAAPSTRELWPELVLLAAGTAARCRRWYSSNPSSASTSHEPRNSSLSARSP